jgi:hypothetical protein
MIDLQEGIYPTLPAVHGGERLAGGGQKTLKLLLYNIIFSVVIEALHLLENIFL